MVIDKQYGDGQREAGVKGGGEGKGENGDGGRLHLGGKHSVQYTDDDGW